MEPVKLKWVNMTIAEHRYGDLPNIFIEQVNSDSICDVYETLERNLEKLFIGDCTKSITEEIYEQENRETHRVSGKTTTGL